MRCLGVDGWLLGVMLFRASSAGSQAATNVASKEACERPRAAQAVQPLVFRVIQRLRLRGGKSTE
jgi:hypothetical protein